jgi:hypothetical protein
MAQTKGGTSCLRDHFDRSSQRFALEGTGASEGITLPVVKRWPLRGREVGSKSDILLSIHVYYFDLAVCGVSARFMEAYTLNCAGLRSAFFLASPSGNCFAALVRAHRLLFQMVRRQKATLFFCRIPRLISMSTNRHQTSRGVRIETSWFQLACHGCGRSVCSAASNARTPVVKA